MSKTENEIRTQVTEGIAALKQLRDEIQLELHLAGMEAKDVWKKLEPRIAGVEKAAHGASHATRDLVNDLLHQAKAFRTAITGTRPN